MDVIARYTNKDLAEIIFTKKSQLEHNSNITALNDEFKTTMETHFFEYGESPTYLFLKYTTYNKRIREDYIKMWSITYRL